MRIDGTDQFGHACHAYAKENRQTKEIGYTCNPPGRGNHKPAFERKFSTEDDAVVFLKAHPSWGFWLKAKDKTGVLFFNFNIDGMPR